MIVRRELAARVMEFAGALLVAAVQHAERARHAEMHQQHLAGRQVGEQILRAPVQALDGRALEPLVEVLRKRKAQVRPALLDPHEARALHHGLQAAAHGFDFGKFGHWLVQYRNELNTRVTSGPSASSLDDLLYCTQ